MPAEEAVELLKRGSYGVLSTVGQDGYPYGVPLSYVFMDNCVYFHCAETGHKLDNIRNNDRVSFCVVGHVEPVPEKLTTKYESVILFGRAVEVEGREKDSALMAIAEKYSGTHLEKAREYIRNSGGRTRVVKVVVEFISGKANR